MAYEERETGNLIGSDKVEGTAVYGADNQRIGSIERVMIDKISGKVAHHYQSGGGFFATMLLSGGPHRSTRAELPVSPEISPKEICQMVFG